MKNFKFYLWIAQMFAYAYAKINGVQTTVETAEKNTKTTIEAGTQTVTEAIKTSEKSVLEAQQTANQNLNQLVAQNSASVQKSVDELLSKFNADDTQFLEKASEPLPDELKEKLRELFKV